MLKAFLITMGIVLGYYVTVLLVSRYLIHRR